MNQLVKQIESNLINILSYLPLALATGELETWSKLYTEGYMLKLRAMR